MNKVKVLGTVKKVRDFGEALELTLEIFDGRELEQDRKQVVVCAEEPCRSEILDLLKIYNILLIEGRVRSSKFLENYCDAGFDGYVIESTSAVGMNREEAEEKISYEGRKGAKDYLNRVAISGKIIGVKQCGANLKVLNLILQGDNARHYITVSGKDKKGFLEMYNMGDELVTKCWYTTRRDKKGGVHRELVADL